MNNPIISDLLNNVGFLFIVQVAVFALPPFYLTTLRRPLRSVAFYVYISIVLVIGGFLGAVYSLPITDSITISGGNLAYGTLIYSAILLVVVAADISAIRNVIRLVITVNVIKYILFSVFSWALSLNTVLNPFNTASNLFAVSGRFVILGGILIVLELIILLFLFEQIKTRVKNYYAVSALYTASFIAVLLLDGVLFPLFAFGMDASLVRIIVGGIAGKLVMASAYSAFLLTFLLVFQNRLATYFATPIKWGELLASSKEELVEEIGRQQQSIEATEAALRESEERLRLALQATKQGLYDLDLQHGTAQINDQYALMLGYDPETFLETNANWQDRLHPDDYDRVTQYLQDYVAGKIAEYRIDFRLRTKENDWVWISSLGRIVSYDEAGNPLRMLGTHTDITDRKMAERRLQEQEEFLSNLLEYAPISIYVLGNDRRLRMVNRRWEADTGQPRAKVLDRHLDYVFPTDVAQRLDADNQNVIDSGTVLIHEEEILQRYFHTIKYPLHNADGQVDAVAGISLEITERLQAAEDLRQRAEELAALNRSALQLAQNPALDDLSQLIVRTCVQTFGAGLAWLLQADPDGSMTSLAHFPATPSFPAQAGDRWDETSLGLEPSAHGIRQGKPQICTDLATLPADLPWRDPARQAGLVASAAFPLISGGRTVGLLNLFSEQPDFFMSQRVAFFQTFTNQAAIALENARLAKEIQVRSDELKELSVRLLRAQEEERRRLSLELHDELGQTLTSIGFDLAAISKAWPPDSPAKGRKHLANAASLLHDVDERVSDLALNLRPQMLDDLGLLPTLSWYVDRYSQNTGITVELETAPIPAGFTPDMITTVYRVVQEALTNVAKHAGASRVTVRLASGPDTFSATVEDNGQGFAMSQLAGAPMPGRGAGLLGMSERATLLGGACTIHSQPGQGTTIALTFPI